VTKSISKCSDADSLFSRREFLLSGAASLAFGLLSNSAVQADPAKSGDVPESTLISEKGATDKKDLPHFDVALFPKDESFRKECIKLARTNLGDRADGYLLAEDAFPHVTLTLFQSEEAKLAEIWKDMAALQSKPMELNFTHIYIDPDMHTSGFLWVGLAVRPHAELTHLQQAVFDKLGSMGIVGRTKPETYFPHVTWSRCRDTVPFALKELPTVEFYKKSYPFEMTIGRSNENGVYRERMYHA
jgi:2'-5' RNA ligase